jgi:hypothetical protein
VKLKVPQLLSSSNRSPDNDVEASVREVTKIEENFGPARCSI